MRRVFLWAARNRWLKEHLPRLRFMRRAVRRFMPGETLEDALAAACRSRRPASGRCTRGSARTSRTSPRPTRSPPTTSRSLDKIVAAGINGEISVKPTQLGLDLDAGGLPRPTSSGSPSTRRRPARTCGSTWKAAPTSRPRSRSYERLRAVQPRTGICLQAYLRRTAADIERLRPLDPAIRLVKGAYDEKAVDRLHGTSGSVDANYVGLAVAVPARRPRPADPARASGRTTSALIEQIADAGRRRPASARDGFEIEMLYGIRTDQQNRLAKAGYRVQALIAYGEHWYPWYMRRLAERPANVCVRPPPDAALGERRRIRDDQRRRDRGPDGHDRDRERVRGPRPRPRARGRRAARSSTSRSASPTSIRRPTSARRPSARSTTARPTTRRSRDPGPARGDRRRRRGAQGRRGRPVAGLRHGRRQGRDAVRDPRPGRSGRRGPRARTPATRSTSR